MWESDKTTYVVISSKKGDLLVEHHVLILDSEVPVVHGGDTAREFELLAVPWEVNAVRRRIA